MDLRHVIARSARGLIARVFILCTACSVSAAPITYVDAVKGAGGNTFATGSLLADTSWESGANSSTADADQWVERTGLTYLNGAGQAFQARVTGDPVTGIPELTTQITDLADGTYDVYVFFWDSLAAGNGWNLSAGLHSGALSTYSFDGLGTTRGVVEASSLEFVSDPIFSDGANLVMYGVKIGQATVTGGGGTVSVFVDHLMGGGSGADSANRTWYDGVGYVAAEPVLPFEMTMSVDADTRLLFDAVGLDEDLEYRLQQTVDLSVADSWVHVSDPVTGVTTAHWELVKSGPRAFYRVYGAERWVDDLETLQAQFVDYAVLNPPLNATVQDYTDTIQLDGSWLDIDYTSTVRGNWPTRDHLDRLETMAAAYVVPDSPFYQDTLLKAQILAGVSYWLDHDFRNDNWYNTEIGVPERMGDIMILMGTDMPQSLIDQAFATVFRSGRTSFGKTGQNKVWKAGVELRKGWLSNDPDLIQAAVAEISSEMYIATGTADGLQSDWSFYQHGPMFQIGNYGLSFADDQVFWAYTLKGTMFEIGEETVGLLRNYILYGLSWVLWQDQLDLSACGRQIDAGDQLSKGARVRSLIGTMAVADPIYEAEYLNRLLLPNSLIGSKVFWRSDYAMHRRPDWYASVRMCSNRIEGGEDVNNENMLGLHQSDGVLLLHQSGQEYESIGGLWDWRRLPGTTVDQGITNLQPTDAKMKGRTAFVGGLGDGAYGVSALDYKRNSLSAKKSWFFEGDAIICLGAGIHGSTTSNVYTSVEQSFWSGAVTTSIGGVSSGSTSLPAGAWVHHADIGYKLDQSATVNVQTVNGNWEPVYTDRGDRPVTGDVFSIWMDHGVSPVQQSYAYTVFPQTSSSEMASKIANHQTVVLSNTTSLQATEGLGGVHAVFYVAGTLTIGSGSVIEVSDPCILSLREDSLILCDPTQSLTSLTVTIDAHELVVTLPSDTLAGQPVSVQL